MWQPYNLNSDRSVQTSKLSMPRLYFMEEFTEWIAELLVNDAHLIIMGDFNFHVNNPNDDDVANFTDTMTALGLVQHISSHTHCCNNTVEIIFREYISGIWVHRCNLSYFISDQCFIEFSTSIQKVEIGQKNIIYTPIKDIDYERMSNEISINRDLKFNDMVKDFNENLVKAMDIHTDHH